jgi:predicted transcriptional regulator
MSEKTKVSYYVAPAIARSVKLLAVRESRPASEVAEEALEAFLSDRQEGLDWQRAAEGAFKLWENPEDAVYDELGDA